uniref:Uncharacterized protein n=2 Tax=Talaromyces marneffei PM1 TaxID=1077442 RepID=A0A093XWW8_TALMA
MGRKKEAQIRSCSSLALYTALRPAKRSTCPDMAPTAGVSQSAVGSFNVQGALRIQEACYELTSYEIGSGSQALTENVRHVKIFPSTGQALSMTPKDNTLEKCIWDTIPRAVPTLPSKPRTYGNGTRSSLTSTETVLNVRRN